MFIVEMESKKQRDEIKAAEIVYCLEDVNIRGMNSELVILVINTLVMNCPTCVKIDITSQNFLK